jgi:sulfofructose kinase
MTRTPVRSNVVCIGVATHDVIALTNAWAGPDGRVLAEDMIEGGGGPAATAAVTLSRLGIPAAFVGRIGDDEASASIRRLLEREGVNTSGLRNMAGAKSPSSVIVVNRATAQRSIVTFPGSRRTIELSDNELASCAAADWIHVDQAGFEAVGQIRGAGILTPVSLDAGNPVPDLDLSLVELYAPTEAALCRTTGAEDLEEALRRALAAGPRMVVVTRGERGSLAATQDAGAVGGLRIIEEPAFPWRDVVSTLGAGDVFHGALLAGLVQGRDLRLSLRYANAAAAISCRAVDGRSGIPGRPELLAAMGE